MVVWTRDVDSDATRLVDELVTAGGAAAWRALVSKIAGPLEQWAARSRVLRRCRLTGEDDVRTVMVDVLERLAADDYRNLRAFVARTPLASCTEEEDLVGDLLRVGRLDEDDRPDARGAEVEADAAARDTPLRAWLLTLLDFAARDHVRRRFGWSATPGALTKRDLHSDAARLDTGHEVGASPGMTDKLTVSRLVAEVDAFITTFPEAMREAIRLWLTDLEPPQIADRLGLTDGAAARALIRAGQARLRERFRGRSTLLFA